MYGVRTALLTFREACSAGGRISPMPGLVCGMQSHGLDCTLITASLHSPSPPFKYGMTSHHPAHYLQKKGSRALAYVCLAIPSQYRPLSHAH